MSLNLSDFPLEIRRPTPSRWDHISRNNLGSLDPNWFLFNLPQLRATRVPTHCVFCRGKIGRGQKRFAYSTGFSRRYNSRSHIWFNLHEHCYYALVVLMIEKLRTILPSNISNKM